jgi:Malonate/sodium symporter MadM subunit.
MDKLLELIEKNGLIFGFVVIGFVFIIGDFLSKNLFRSKVPGSAVSIFLGLVLGYLGGLWSDGEKGISDLSLFAGVGILGGSMFRDFTIVATALGANLELIRKAGWLGLVSLLMGIVFVFFPGGWTCLCRGVFGMLPVCAPLVQVLVPTSSVRSLVLLVGASSEVIALSIAIGVSKNHRCYDFHPNCS